jgi:hypothetical protein
MNTLMHTPLVHVYLSSPKKARFLTNDIHLSSILPKIYPKKKSIHPNTPLFVSSSSAILHCHHIVNLSSPIIIHYLNVNLTKLDYPLHHATQVQSIFFTKMARFATFKVWHLVPRMSFWDMGLTTLMCVSCHFVPSWMEDWSIMISWTLIWGQVRCITLLWNFFTMKITIYYNACCELYIKLAKSSHVQLKFCCQQYK